jgi:putative ABC transport system permease protein
VPTVLCDSLADDLNRPRLTALLWIITGRWKEQPGRIALAIFAVALGVALGLAIHLVNRSALAEFSDAIALVNGQAHRQIVAANGSFDELVFEEVAVIDGVSVTSPIIETTASIDTARIRLIGLDVFKAAEITPELVFLSDLIRIDDSLMTFNSDQIFLSAAALSLAKKQVGDSVTIKVAGVEKQFIIAARLSQIPSGQAIATMDIANLQSNFATAWLGKINRIDIRLNDAVDKAKTERTLIELMNQSASKQVQSGPLRMVTPSNSTERISNVSRAYRVNLTVLGLVALVVGGFLVFATMTLLAQRQLPDAALLSLLGLNALQIRNFVLAQGVAIGLIGSCLGLLCGLGLAQGFLSLLGGDLGGGYFNGPVPTLSVSAFDLIGFSTLGLCISILAVWPAASHLMQASVNPSELLMGNSGISEHQGGQSLGTSKSLRRMLGITALTILLAGALLQLPAIWSLPIGGFFAMAIILIGGIALVPWITHQVANFLSKFNSPYQGFNLWRHPSLWLAAQRLGRYPKTVSTALAGIVASVALASAMAIMVHSFRGSVDTWLSNIVPADIYLRSDAQLSTIDQANIGTLPGIERADFLQTVDVLMRSDLPKVAVVGRSFPKKAINEMLPLTGAVVKKPLDQLAVTVYGSEAMVDLYGWKIGHTIESPMGGQPWFIAGIWRDYGRQHGAVAMDLADLGRITGTPSASDIAVWLSPGTSGNSVVDRLKQYPQLGSSQARSSESIRALSLKIFDRSFVLTYVIEAIAIAVALFGVASTYAGESLSRTKEFGVLQHLGATNWSVTKQLIAEAFIAITLAVFWGAFIGVALAWVLVRRINPQSFHWSMDFSWPWPLLGVSAAVLIFLGIASALLAYRSTLQMSPSVAIKA